MRKYSEHKRKMNSDEKSKKELYKQLSEQKRITKDFYNHLEETIGVVKQKNRKNKTFYIVSFLEINESTKKYIKNFYSLLVENNVRFAKKGKEHNIIIPEKDYERFLANFSK